MFNLEHLVFLRTFGLALKQSARNAHAKASGKKSLN